jgi:polar amino acid transport system substrate-binding protein
MFLLAGAGQLAAALPADAIRVTTSDLPPYAIEATPATPGAIFELVDELLKRTRLPGQIEFYPWRRALFMTTSMPRTAIFPLTRTSEREQQFRWLARLYHENFVFTSLKSSRFDARNAARNRELKIAVLRGSASTKYLKELGYTHLVPASSAEESLRFLNGGMADVIFGDRELMRAALGGTTGAELVISEPVRTSTTWLGGSLDMGETEVALFQKAMREIVADGTFARIMKKYELPATPPAAQ